MKWIWRVLALLVVVIVVVVGVGALLPQQHVASRTAQFKQPPDEIWAAVTNCAAFASWRPDVRRVECVEGGARPSWREIGSSGTITLEVTEADPPRRLVTQIADQDLPFGGRWVYEIRPTDGGAELKITEEGEVYNPVFRFMSRFIFGHHATIEAYLKALGKKFNEDVEVRS